MQYKKVYLEPSYHHNIILGIV